jgi:tRNA A37 threonylcarbamoyladenosine modification protein TsaB
MIKNFLVINCTGKNDTMGLRVNNNFFIYKFPNNVKVSEILLTNILDFLKKNEVKINQEFSIILNSGPGSFSSIRCALSVAKGIQISRGAKLYAFLASQLDVLNLENIEYLIKKNLLENKLIKPIYIS